MINRFSVKVGAIENSIVVEYGGMMERWQITGLNGSEKQVNWAVSIIMNRIQRTCETLARYERAGAPKEKLDIVFNKLLEKLEINDAKYWIETRDVPLDKFLLK